MMLKRLNSVRVMDEAGKLGPFTVRSENGRLVSFMLENDEFVISDGKAEFIFSSEVAKKIAGFMQNLKVLL